jgi:hypothetical protein
MLTMLRVCFAALASATLLGATANAQTQDFPTTVDGATMVGAEVKDAFHLDAGTPSACETRLLDPQIDIYKCDVAAAQITLTDAQGQVRTIQLTNDGVLIRHVRPGQGELVRYYDYEGTYTTAPVDGRTYTSKARLTLEIRRTPTGDQPDGPFTTVTRGTLSFPDFGTSLALVVQ